MAIPSSLLPSTCDVYRPFDDSSPLTTGIPCRLTPALAALTGKLVVGLLGWTHTLDFQPGVDIRDGVTRSAGTVAISYSDGDEVRIGGTRYVVVWVETVGRDSPMQFQRAYLLRHEAAWPDP